MWQVILLQGHVRNYNKGISFGEGELAGHRTGKMELEIWERNLNWQGKGGTEVAGVLLSMSHPTCVLL